MSIQTTLEKWEANMMDEIKNFELGEEPRFLSKKWEIAHLTKMVKGEAKISILHKDLSVVKTEYFVSGKTKDKIDYTALAFGLLIGDDIDKIFWENNFIL